MKILITSVPMMGMIEELKHRFDEVGAEIYCPEVVQALPEDKLVELVPGFDGWIIGDDPATRRVFEAGSNGSLKAAVKWGVGTDNVDFDAAGEFSIPVGNTPNMFGREVGDSVMSFLVALSRKTFLVDREVKAGKWPKPRGMSLADKTVGLVGYGNLGTAIARRMLVADMKIIAYTRTPRHESGPDGLEFAQWPDRIGECDFIVLACSLNSSNVHMLNELVFAKVKRGVRIINVARGALISEPVLIEALTDGTVHSVALDVYEKEPLPHDSQLRNFEQCLFGSHNCSNTSEAVLAASEQAVLKLFGYLGIGDPGALRKGQ